jgi:hypothetical protein
MRMEVKNPTKCRNRYTASDCCNHTGGKKLEAIAASSFFISSDTVLPTVIIALLRLSGCRHIP